ncbi:hypothetical protein BD626DRAFT_474812 [Schizophyllum amplum]|uniref:Mitochondrial import inner membrane translocase subunit TIM16 n=1 Tax=Schizophyllum amplum TaxID=97359 RepID=A0A550CXW9_9AGAR|nr:hypothetical protein BD626DRAFT_474812 [Auriculariopsis ampla]
MSSPKALIQVLISGSVILGRALRAGAQQAVKNAKYSPQAVAGGDVAGLKNATSQSMTDQLTRQHRMTLDEAELILNVKREAEMEQVMKNYEHLFKMNAAPEAPAQPQKPVRGKKVTPPSHSHYLQSKVVRARERIEAERQTGQPPSGSPMSADAPPPPPAEAPKSG